MNKHKTSHKTKLLITRAEQAGSDLQSFLNENGYHSYCQPLFDYQANDTEKSLLEILKNTQAQSASVEKSPIIIFVSVAAVKFAEQLKAISSWLTLLGEQPQVIAVGNATQQALAELGIFATVPEKQQSEGVLALPCLQNVKQASVIIVRGDGGRELIADTLTARGANIHYFESYQRVWRKYPVDVVDLWQNAQVDSVLVTSTAILTALVQLINQRLAIDNNINAPQLKVDKDKQKKREALEHPNKIAHYWFEQCLWLVASERIANKASALGIKKIVNINGASHQAILKALISLS